jgi:hypothetical protein
VLHIADNNIVRIDKTLVHIIKNIQRQFEEQGCPIQFTQASKALAYYHMGVWNIQVDTTKVRKNPRIRRGREPSPFMV